MVAKFTSGTADIDLTGVAHVAEVERLKQLVTAAGPVGFEARGASARFRRACPVLDPDASLESQLDAAREFADQLAWLHRWWHDVGRDLVGECLLGE